MKGLVVLFFSIAALYGCGSHQVEVATLNSDLGVKSVCIERNMAVTVGEFLPVVQDGFSRHGIVSKLYFGGLPSDCDAIATYTALRSWDLATYLRTANVHLYIDGKKVAGFDYYHPNNLNATKWQSVKEKIEPAMGKMLIEYPVDGRESWRGYEDRRYVINRVHVFLCVVRRSECRCVDI